MCIKILPLLLPPSSLESSLGGPWGALAGIGCGNLGRVRNGGGTPKNGRNGGQAGRGASWAAAAAYSCSGAGSPPSSTMLPPPPLLPPLDILPIDNAHNTNLLIDASHSQLSFLIHKTFSHFCSLPRSPFFRCRQMSLRRNVYLTHIFPDAWC